MCANSRKKQTKNYEQKNIWEKRNIKPLGLIIIKKKQFRNQTSFSFEIVW